MTSPYDDLDRRSFWRSGVAEAGSAAPPDLYRKKFAITPEMKVATAGSCFAQHIGRALKSRGFTVLDLERPPALLDEATAHRFGYGIYSARYGNIYSVAQLLQLIEEVRGARQPVEYVWEKNGRYFDALRPSVESNGLASPQLVEAHRAYHRKRVRRMFKSADVLIFTLGLTETWRHKADGTVYPTAPGVLAGTFDPDRHEFHNAGFEEIHRDFLAFRTALQRINPAIRILLTVSPVPLTATASGAHVLAATTYSKSVLRAVAGTLAAQFHDVDYFPSYEIVTGIQSRWRFFDENLRTVLPEGVTAVMDVFFSEHGGDVDTATKPDRAARRVRRKMHREATADDIVCEDALLEAFSR
jgi:hypothetical protein